MGKPLESVGEASPKWAGLEIYYQLSIEKIPAGPWRPGDPWDLLQLPTRHRVRSPREGRDAAHRVRGLPARYAPACARLAASASHWHLRSGPLWPASVGELKSPASVPLAGAQRRRGSRCAPQEAETRQPHACLCPRGRPLLPSPGIADSVCMALVELERASLGCQRQRPILQRCLQGRSVESRLARRPGEAARARNLHAFFLRCSRRWESVLQSRPVDPMISLWVLLVRTGSVCSVLENCLYACRIGVSRER